jgi:hypothetical protein
MTGKGASRSEPHTAVDAGEVENSLGSSVALFWSRTYLFHCQFFDQDKVRRRLLTGLEALSFCEACHVCIEYPAHGTLCRPSQDCHRGTATPVSSVLLRQQKQNSSKVRMAHLDFARAACIARIFRTPTDLPLFWRGAVVHHHGCERASELDNRRNCEQTKRNPGVENPRIWGREPSPSGSGVMRGSIAIGLGQAEPHPLIVSALKKYRESPHKPRSCPQLS